MLVWLPVLCVVGLVNSKELPSNRYHNLRGHQVWHVSGDSADNVVQSLESEGVVDVLDHSRSRRSLRIAPEHQQYVHNALKDKGMDYKIHIDELLAFFEEKESREQQDLRASRSSGDVEAQKCTSNSCPQPLTDNYMTLEQIEWYISEIARSFPDRVNVTSIGKSVEGRDIWLVHVKPGNCNGGKKDKRRRAKRMAWWAKAKRTLWIEGGLHAREWISPAVALAVLDRFLKECSVSRTNELYIVPMSNPDGYEYTWTTNRLWRKNRAVIPGSTCMGVDLNRNWDYHWGVGASSSPCSETYKGPSGFSEPETKALRDAMKSVGNIDLVLSLHSYGQTLMYPWGWTDKPAPDTDQMKRMGDIFAGAARERQGSVYEVVNSAGGFYYASGATDDWAKEELKSPYVYTLELRDTGHHGFQLPRDQIKDTGNEVWDGLKRFLAALNPARMG